MWGATQVLHRIFYFLFGALLAYVFMASAAGARTWHVKADGSGDAPTIQAAIDSSATGDSVAVAAGLYDENLVVPGGKELFLFGESGLETTVVDGGQRGRVVTMSGGGSVEGLTLRNGLASQGGGLLVEGPPILVRNNVIEDNRAGLSFDAGTGGGIRIRGVGKIVESNIIRNNIAGDLGGGVYDGGSTPARRNVLRNNQIIGNLCKNGGGGIFAAGTLVVNNLILNNESTYAVGGVWLEHTGEVRNNTVVGNKVGSPVHNGAGIHVRSGFFQSPVISHNIVAFNTRAGPFSGGSGVGIWCNPIPGGLVTPIVTCNDTWGNDFDEVSCEGTVDNNFSADPLFCDIRTWDYRIEAESPCAPTSNADCGLIGAYSVSCGDVSIAKRRWTDIKRLYR